MKSCNLFLLADPTYMIRAVPGNAADNVYCTLLAQSVVHGAMAGYTGFTSGLVNGRQTYIPFYVSFSLAYNRNVFLMVGSFLFV
jgi:6-phosphofructokinase